MCPVPGMAGQQATATRPTSVDAQLLVQGHGTPPGQASDATHHCDAACGRLQAVQVNGQGASRLTGTVYARNRQRMVVSAGPPGPIGDQVFANGLLYANPNDSTPIGVFDLVAFTTSVEGAFERRQVFIELSIDRSFIRRAWYPALPEGAPGGEARSDLNLMGTETYPIGGGILVDPLQLGVSAGTGVFQDCRGMVTTTYDPSLQVFAYRLNVVRHP